MGSHPCRALHPTGMTSMPSSCRSKDRKGVAAFCRPPLCCCRHPSCANHKHTPVLAHQSFPDLPSAITLTCEPAWAKGVLCQCRWRISHSWRGKDNYLARFSSPDLPDRDEAPAGNYTEVLLQPGDMLYMPRGAPAKLSQDDSDSLHAFHITAERLLLCLRLHLSPWQTVLQA